MEIEEILTLLKNKIHFPYAKRFMKGKKILDIGCGNGVFAQALKESVDCDLTLLDVGDFRHPKLKKFPFVIASAEKLPFPNSSFNVVYVQLVLHHINPEVGIEKVFKEFSRVSSDRIILYEEIASKRTDIPKAKKFDEEVNLNIVKERDAKVYDYYTLPELKKVFKKTNLKMTFHKILKKGSEKDGFLEKHFFVLEKEGRLR